MSLDKLLIFLIQWHCAANTSKKNLHANSISKKTRNIARLGKHKGWWAFWRDRIWDVWCTGLQGAGVRRCRVCTSEEVTGAQVHPHIKDHGVQKLTKNFRILNYSFLAHHLSCNVCDVSFLLKKDPLANITLLHTWACLCPRPALQGMNISCWSCPLLSTLGVSYLCTWSGLVYLSLIHIWRCRRRG